MRHETTESPGMKILLVDDDEKLTFVLSAHMKSAGYEVVVAHDAGSAIESARSFLPDIIVMDFQLPDGDGIGATRTLKANPKTADIPVIILTCHSDKDLVVTALEAGAQEFINKPFDIAELLARIRTVYRLSKTRRELDDLNERLVSEIDKRTRRLRVLYGFARDLNDADSRGRILDLIIEAVENVTGSRRISVLLKEPRSDTLICGRATGISQETADAIRVATNEGVAGQVFCSGKTFVANTYDTNFTHTDRYSSDAFVSTPLVATSLDTREETLGVLSITHKPGGGGFTADEIECIRSIADTGAIALHNQVHVERLSESVNVLLMTVGRLAEYRDNETSRHLERVREYARTLAGELVGSGVYDGVVTDEFVDNLHRAAPMHDIGKVGIPDQILCKPEVLTKDEHAQMSQHCRMGRDVLESAMEQTGPVPILKMCVDIAYSHHEKFDGSGYPQGLSGDVIPPAARIIALVDAYDAITSRRRYKEPIAHERAIEIILADAGKHFDPKLIEPFKRCADEFNRIRLSHPDPDPTPAELTFVQSIA